MGNAISYNHHIFGNHAAPANRKFFIL